MLTHKQFVDAEVVDVFTEDIPPVLRINSQIMQASSTRQNPPIRPSRLSSRPLCLLLPLLRAFPNLVLPQQCIALIYAPYNYNPTKALQYHHKNKTGTYYQHIA